MDQVVMERQPLKNLKGYGLLKGCLSQILLDPSLNTFAAENTIISPNFLAWKFCEKAQFPHSFGQFAQNCAKTVTFHKTSMPRN